MKFKIVLFVILFVNLSIFAQEKRIAEVQIEGARKTKVSFIKSLLLAKSGQVLDSSSLNKEIAL